MTRGRSTGYSSFFIYVYFYVLELCVSEKHQPSGTELPVVVSCHVSVSSVRALCVLNG